MKVWMREKMNEWRRIETTQNIRNIRKNFKKHVDIYSKLLYISLLDFLNLYARIQIINMDCSGIVKRVGQAILNQQSNQRKYKLKNCAEKDTSTAALLSKREENYEIKNDACSTAFSNVFHLL